MRRLTVLFVIIVMITTVFITGNASPACTETEPVATVSNVEGRVEKLVNNWFLNIFQIKAWHVIKNGDNLNQGDVN